MFESIESLIKELSELQETMSELSKHQGPFIEQLTVTIIEACQQLIAKIKEYQNILIPLFPKKTVDDLDYILSKEHQKNELKSKRNELKKHIHDEIDSSILDTLEKEILQIENEIEHIPIEIRLLAACREIVLKSDEYIKKIEMDEFDLKKPSSEEDKASIEKKAVLDDFFEDEIKELTLDFDNLSAKEDCQEALLSISSYTPQRDTPPHNFLKEEKENVSLLSIPKPSPPLS